MSVEKTRDGSAKIVKKKSVATPFFFSCFSRFKGLLPRVRADDSFLPAMLFAYVYVCVCVFRRIPLDGLISNPLISSSTIITVREEE